MTNLIPVPSAHAMSANHEIERLKQNQKEIENSLNEYLEANKQNLDEFLKRTYEQYRTYIVGQIELLQSQIKSAIQNSNNMIISFNKSLIDDGLVCLDRSYCDRPATCYYKITWTVRKGPR